VALVVASDHHVPDAAAFAAAAEAAVGAAAADFIVTMGVAPSGPNTAYGYIAPGEAAGGVRKVAAFVEKPNAAKATDYLAQGYLWNSGNFVARAALLLGELERLAPAVAYAARAGIAGAREADGATWLGDAFRAAPKKSIDYAVMEKTERAAVLPVSFAWSDLGAWDAVWAVSDRDANANAVRGAVTLHDVENALVRAAPGMRVVAIGVRDVAIVAEPGRVLVSGLDTAQSVKPIVEALRDTAEDGAPAPFDSLDAAKPWFGRWLRVNALPLWWSLGADHARGGFHEALTLDGRPCDWPRRMRVQARQVYAYAQAGMMGWPGPWQAAALHGLTFLDTAYLRADGLYRTLISAEGDALDDTARLYDQAFVLLALAALHRASPDDALRTRADALCDTLQPMRHAGGGFREAGPHEFQANAHMHLLEAALAWREAGGDARWARLADEIVALALSRFIDGEGGFLREFFDDGWAPAKGEAGRRIEPGHQFEWAWLLARYGERDAARRLFAAGLRGVDPRRAAAVQALRDDFTPIEPDARLWAQTEYLKAALVLGEREHALAAARTCARFLRTPAPGLWRDRLKPDNSFAEEPATASSLYHIITAIAALERDTR
jgi:mannose/cellobiose epimerase-like protein (N-acyl-D-glucosamine 2-epimerase family)